MCDDVAQAEESPSAAAGLEAVETPPVLFPSAGAAMGAGALAGGEEPTPTIVLVKGDRVQLAPGPSTSSVPLQLLSPASCPPASGSDCLHAAVAWANTEGAFLSQELQRSSASSLGGSAPSSPSPRSDATIFCCVVQSSERQTEACLCAGPRRRHAVQGARAGQWAQLVVRAPASGARLMVAVINQAKWKSSFAAPVSFSLTASQPEKSRKLETRVVLCPYAQRARARAPHCLNPNAGVRGREGDGDHPSDTA